MPRNLVLIVQDDPFLKEDAVTLLDETVELVSADEALPYLVEHAGEVAAVFTDVQTLVALDGPQLACSIKSTWPEILVFVTSGRTSLAGDVPENVGFMTKPWWPLDERPSVAQAA